MGDDVPGSPIPPIHGLPPIGGWPPPIPGETPEDPEIPYTTHALYHYDVGVEDALAVYPFLFYDRGMKKAVPAGPTLETDTGIAARKGKILAWHLSSDAEYGTEGGGGVVVWYTMSPDGRNFSPTLGTGFYGATICTGCFGTVNDECARILVSTNNAITELIIDLGVDESGLPVARVRRYQVRLVQSVFPQLVACCIFGGAIWPVPDEDDRCAILWVQERVPNMPAKYLQESFYEYTKENTLVHIWTSPAYEDEDDVLDGIPSYGPGRPVYLFPYGGLVSGYSFWW